MTVNPLPAPKTLRGHVMIQPVENVPIIGGRYTVVPGGSVEAALPPIAHAFVKGLLDSRLGKRIFDPINIDPVIYFWGDRLCFNPYCGDTQEYQDADVAHMLCCSFTVMWFGFHYCWTGPT